MQYMDAYQDGLHVRVEAIYESGATVMFSVNYATSQAILQWVSEIEPKSSKLCFQTTMGEIVVLKHTTLDGIMIHLREAMQATATFGQAELHGCEGSA